MKRIWLFPAVVALLAAACGGAADADEGVASLDDAVDLEAVSATVVLEQDAEAALLAFAACMRDHGIDLEDPTVDAEGNLQLSRPAGAGQDPDFDREAAQAAREACGEHLEGVTLGFRDQDRTEIEDQLLEFATCMRDNGYDMPDPDFTNATPGPGGGPFGQIDRDDPTFQAAAEACQDILAGFPGRGPGRGPGN